MADIDLERYLDAVGRLVSKLGLRNGGGPSFVIRKTRSGVPMGLELFNGNTELPRGTARLVSTEKARIIGSRAVKVERHKYQFLPHGDERRTLFEFRLDKDGADKPAHANPAGRWREILGDHLQYPSGTRLNIDGFCFLYALVVSVQYEADPGRYPLDPDHAGVYNQLVERMRKRVERR